MTQAIRSIEELQAQLKQKEVKLQMWLQRLSEAQAAMMEAQRQIDAHQGYVEALRWAVAGEEDE